MLKIVNLILPLGFDIGALEDAVSKRLRKDKSEIKSITLDKRELVKGDMVFKVTALAELEPDIEKQLALILRKKGVSLFEETPYSAPRAELNSRPIVIGFGPAGIFAALVLAEAGAAPIVLERGPDTEERVQLVDTFSKSGALNPEGNIQFGEGGAGAFSDGKLKIGYKDSRKRKILEEFVSSGADESILYLEKPHVGSDVLHRVIVNLRKKIISLGGEIHFNSKAVSLDIEENAVKGVTYLQDGVTHRIDADSVILATGHSARDTYEYLADAGVAMEQKGFGIGVRIEHPQELINGIEYGDKTLSETLGAADYKLVEHLGSGRSLYTFCMCPGGYVVPAASEEGGICTNGMSEFARDGENANTALLVSVTPEDFDSRHPLSGIELQRKIERLAFEVSGCDYSAPIIRLEDFLAHRESTALGSVKPTYKPNTKFASPDRYLPEFICTALRDGIKQMCEYKKGYYCPDAVLTGPETRTTSPVRIIRNDDCISNIAGLYPAGEGAGYAGGIISSAADGMICAEKLMKGHTK